MKTAAINLDRRRHGRMRIDYKAIALSFDCVGHMLEMSSGGFSAKCSNGHFVKGFDCRVDILAGYKNLFVTDIPIRLVWVRSPESSPFFTISSQTFGAEFCNVTDLQKLQIESFMRNIEGQDVSSISLTVQPRSVGYSSSASIDS